MSKYGMVQRILTESEEIKEWYETEFNVFSNMLTPETVNTYGNGAECYGDISDQILFDGIEGGVFKASEIEDVVMGA